MKLLQVDTIEQAKQKLHDHIPKNWRKTTRVPLLEALGCYLAEDLYASFSVPDFRRSTVDGYAIYANDSWGASTSMPVMLEPIGEVSMGTISNLTVSSGSCVYVPTGGMVPDGATAMVMIEYTELLDDNTLLVYSSVAEGSHIVNVAEDISQDELVVQAGNKLTTRHLAVIASLGMDQVLVYRELTVSILSTGDEVIPPGSIKKVGQVYDINTYGIAGYVREENYRIHHMLLIPDEEDQLELQIRDAMKHSDLVLISGGSSQGIKDATERIIDRVAKPGVLTHGLAAKPGKPTIMGYDSNSSTLLIGLPGHPVAAMMIFRVVILSFLQEQIQRLHPTTAIPDQVLLDARLTKNTPSSPGRATIQLVQIHYKNNEAYAEPIFGKSGVMKTLLDANGYFIMDTNSEGQSEDDRVEVHLL